MICATRDRSTRGSSPRPACSTSTGKGSWRRSGATTGGLFRRSFGVRAPGTCGILLPALAIERGLSYGGGLRPIEREQTIRADAAASQVASQISAIENQVKEVANLPWGRTA